MEVSWVQSCTCGGQFMNFPDDNVILISGNNWAENFKKALNGTKNGRNIAHFHLMLINHHFQNKSKYQKNCRKPSL